MTDLCAQEKMESYNPFSMAVKMKYSPPSISALLLIFLRICALSSCSGQGVSVEGQLDVIRACLPKPSYTDQFAVAEIQNTNLGQ